MAQLHFVWSIHVGRADGATVLPLPQAAGTAENCSRTEPLQKCAPCANCPPTVRGRCTCLLQAASILCVEASHSGRMLFTGSSDGAVRAHDLRMRGDGGLLLWQHTAAVQDLSFEVSRGKRLPRLCCCILHFSLVFTASSAEHTCSAVGLREKCQ